MSSTSAISRLRELPEVFTLSSLCRLTDIGEAQATTYVHRWKRAGHIEPAGPRLGVFFNKIRSPETTLEQRVAALRTEFPSAVLAGVSVLHAEGWITQIPFETHVYVLSRKSYCQITGFDLKGRSRTWYAKALAMSRKLGPEITRFGLPALHPAVALAEIYADPTEWHPDADDLYIPPNQLKRVEKAFMELLGRIPENVQALFE